MNIDSYPLLIAMRMGDLELLFSLIDDIDAHDGSNRTCLHLASRNSQLDAVKELVRRGANIDAADCIGDTPLTDAIDCGNIEIVRFLIQSGASIHGYPEHGRSLRSNPDILRYILENGADPSKGDGNGDTLLHYAVRNNFVEMVEILLEFNANRNKINNEGFTPMNYASNKDMFYLLKNYYATDIKEPAYN